MPSPNMAFPPRGSDAVVTLAAGLAGVAALWNFPLAATLAGVAEASGEDPTRLALAAGMLAATACGAGVLVAVSAHRHRRPGSVGRLVVAGAVALGLVAQHVVALAPDLASGTMARDPLGAALALASVPCAGLCGALPILVSSVLADCFAGPVHSLFPAAFGRVLQRGVRRPFARRVAPTADEAAADADTGPADPA